MGGEYRIRQSSVVGWVYVAGDRSFEWWAYLDGPYAWADSGSSSECPWHLSAEYVGGCGWATFEAWKSEVLQRSEALGKTVVFQRHAVTEESVQN